MKISPKAPPLNPQEAREKIKNDKLMKLSRQFESMFVNQMVTAMRKTVVKQGLVQESHAEKVYQSMLDSSHSEQISQSEQLGLSRMIYDQLLRSTGGR